MEYISSENCANINVIDYHGGYFEPEKGRAWRCKTHITKENKFYYITSGECYIYIDGCEYTASAGDWFFIPAGVSHRYYNDPQRPFKKYWVTFDVLPESAFFSHVEIKHCVKINPDSKEHSLFKRYAQINFSSSFADRLEIKSIIFQLLCCYLRLSDASVELSFSEGGFLFKVQAYLDENIGRNVTNAELANFLHIHPSHLIRMFKTATGITPKEYITTHRVMTAKKLLSGTDSLVSEIAETVGYFDAAAFSKAFKKHTRLSPAEFRKNNKI